MQKIKEFIKKMPEHIKEALWYLLFPVPIYTLFGLLIGSLIALLNTRDSYLHNVYNIVVGSYIYFGGASLAIYGLLRLITKPSTVLHVGFGPGLFYGTFFLASFLRSFISTSESNLYIISFVLVALICYIIWLKNFKPKGEKQ